MRYELGIEHATVVTGQGRRLANVYVEAGRIVAVVEECLPARRRVDADGLFMLPGMIDGHCHFQDPGDTTREDFITGSSAAAAGGVTTVIEHTHSDPVTDVASLKAKARYLEGRSVVDFGLAAHVWPATIGAVEDLWLAGATFFKVFTCTTHGVPAILAGPMLRLFRNLAAVDALCLVHCEDESITGDNEALLRGAGRVDPSVIPEWRTREAEQVAVETVALLARQAGVRAIIAHVSHPAAVALINRERELGARLWAEACPQYFYLDETAVVQEGPFRKFTPPARSTEEARALWSCLATGGLTHISSDHAPATVQQKQEGARDIWRAPFGLPGVQTTLTMMLQAVHDGRLTLERLSKTYAEVPAHLYGLAPRKGRVAVGADADFVLIDMTKRHVLTNESMLSKAGWTPYAGRAVVGAPIMTFIRGQLVAEDGRVQLGPGYGRYIAGTGTRQ